MGIERSPSKAGLGCWEKNGDLALEIRDFEIWVIRDLGIWNSTWEKLGIRFD